MTILDPPLLEIYRQKRFCEYCGYPLAQCEAAHIQTKGLGGGSQLDIPINLVGLGGPWDCRCHADHHNGRPPMRSELLRLVAAREGCTVAFIVNELARILQIPKDSHEAAKEAGKWQSKSLALRRRAGMVVDQRPNLFADGPRPASERSGLSLEADETVWRDL